MHLMLWLKFSMRIGEAITPLAPPPPTKIFYMHHCLLQNCITDEDVFLPVGEMRLLMH